MFNLCIDLGSFYLRLRGWSSFMLKSGGDVWTRLQNCLHVRLKITSSVLKLLKLWPQLCLSFFIACPWLRFCPRRFNLLSSYAYLFLFYFLAMYNRRKILILCLVIKLSFTRLWSILTDCPSVLLRKPKLEKTILRVSSIALNMVKLRGCDRILRVDEAHRREISLIYSFPHLSWNSLILNGCTLLSASCCQFIKLVYFIGSR